MMSEPSKTDKLHTLGHVGCVSYIWHLPLVVLFGRGVAEANACNDLAENNNITRLTTPKHDSYKRVLVDICH